MKKFNAKKLFCLLLSLALIAVMAFAMQACTQEKPKDGESISTESTASSTQDLQMSTEKTVLGEGAVQFLFNVTHKDGSVKQFEINTDKKTVGEALLDLKLIAGDDGEYGLYVKTVDGETLGYDKDQMYWAFYENGNYASKGVDQTEITAGATYEFKAEK